MKRTWILLVLGTVLAACGKEEPASSPAPLLEPLALSPAPTNDKLFSVENMLRGAQLYQEQCAQCHGPEAQGHPDWQNPLVAAAPPLNGTGNEWKRKKSELIAIVRNGSTKNGMPVMPAWKGRLTDKEIEDIITWFQALWPPEIYDNWRKANAAPASPRG